MDGRDGQPIHNSAAYFMQQRGLGGSGPQNIYYGNPGIRPVPGGRQNLPVQAGNVGGGGPGGSGFHQGESPPPLSPPHLGAVGGRSGSDPRVAGGVVGSEQGEPRMKKKRGRPRKYGPDGKEGHPLSPGVSGPGMGSGGGGTAGGDSGSGSMEPSASKRGRGRPPGSGKKQQLASFGEWISSTAGGSFTPHMLTISSGEDIDAQIQAFSQKASRVVCVLSARGSVSTVTLRQPSGGTVTYEGIFEILCLSGSYVLADSGGTQSRSGGLGVSLAGHDGRVVGGGVGGQLIASSSVQVILGSFVFSGSKSKKKLKSVAEIRGEDDIQTGEQLETPPSTSANHNLNQILSGWSAPRQLDMRNPHMDIDLTRG